MSHKKSVTFKAWFNGEAKIFQVRGQVARTITALAIAGKEGVTALEISTWALRLGAYIHDLRRDCGLDIETQREPHDDEGGWHGRYVLITPVEILEAE